MATWADVRKLALALPETDEVTSRDNMTWRVKQKGFVWERPLRESDRKALAALGAEAPTGLILAARVADEGVKHALIASAPDLYFTVPHFNGYPAILVRLGRISAKELRELVTDAWLARAPAKLATAYLAEH